MSTQSLLILSIIVPTLFFVWKLQLIKQQEQENKIKERLGHKASFMFRNILRTTRFWKRPQIIDDWNVILSLPPEEQKKFVEELWSDFRTHTIEASISTFPEMGIEEARAVSARRFDHLYEEYLRLS